MANQPIPPHDTQPPAGRRASDARHRVPRDETTAAIAHDPWMLLTDKEATQVFAGGSCVAVRPWGWLRACGDFSQVSFTIHRQRRTALLGWLAADIRTPSGGQLSVAAVLGMLAGLGTLLMISSHQWLPLTAAWTTALAAGVLTALAARFPAARQVRGDSYPLEPASPLVALLVMDHQGTDAGLVSHLLSHGWALEDLDQSGMPELVSVAARVLHVAGQLGLEEPAVEVPGLLASSRTQPDRRAATASLLDLYTDLHHTLDEVLAHTQLVTEPHQAALAQHHRELDAAALQYAAGRAAASLQSSRHAADREARVHSDLATGHHDA